MTTSQRRPRVGDVVRLWDYDTEEMAEGTLDHLDDAGTYAFVRFPGRRELGEEYVSNLASFGGATWQQLDI